MRNLLCAMVLTAMLPAAAVSQTAPVSAVPAAAAYSTATTDLGTLLDYPATKAVLDKHVATLVNNDQIAMARGMTLKGLQQYAGDALTDDTLAKIDADLAKVPAKK